MPDLSVASLVCLDARQRLLKEVVVCPVGNRGHRHELEVRKAGLEHEVELQGHVYGVGRQEHVVEQVPRGDDQPLVGVIGPVCPVEVAVETQQVVAEEQGDLRMADFVESSQRGHGAPCAVAPEARHP